MYNVHIIYLLNGQDASAASFDENYLTLSRGAMDASSAILKGASVFKVISLPS